MESEPQQDIVTEQWLRRHGIVIPRAPGVHKSGTAWVRVDSRHVIVSAGEVDQRVVAWLVDRNILSDGDIDYAIAYVTCRDAHRSYRRERGYRSHLDITVGGDSLSCEQAARVFSLVRRNLGSKYCRIVEYACDTVRKPETAVNYHPPYRQAFTALAREFDSAKKWVRENPIDPPADDFPVALVGKL